MKSDVISLNERLEIKEILLKQLRILEKYSEGCCSEEISPLSLAMTELVGCLCNL